MCKIVTAGDNTDPFKQITKNTKQKGLFPSVKHQDFLSKNCKIVAGE